MRVRRETQHTPPRRAQIASRVSLYKILIHFKALLWHSMLLLVPPPLAKSTLFQYYCTTIAQSTPPPPTPLLYAIHYTLLVMAILSEGQVAPWPRALRKDRWRYTRASENLTLVFLRERVCGLIGRTHLFVRLCDRVTTTAVSS